MLPDYPNAESFSCILSDNDFVDLSDQYEDLKNKVRQGQLGRTAQFWVSYCDCVWTLLRFQLAVKMNDLSLFIRSLREMCGILFSSNHLNYAKYLPLYYTQLMNLDSTHPGASTLLRMNGFTAARSNVPGCRNAMDLTIEQTINRSAKTAGGIIGFSRNKAAYYRWCVTRHKRAAYADVLLDQLNMLSSGEDEHKSVGRSEIKQSESEVTNVLSAFKQFVNPFCMQEDNRNKLHCISSGLPANDIVERDLLQYTSIGNEKAEQFITSRLIEKSIKFQDPVNKSKLSTFKCMAVKKTLTSKQNKTIEITAERNVLGNILVLSQKYEISLEKLFCYPLGPIPWSLATADGSLVKTDKAQLMHVLEDKGVLTAVPDIEECCYILDGNVIIQATVLQPETSGEFALKIFHILPKAPIVHFVTDTYREGSIKEQERRRRCAGMSTIEYENITSNTKIPRDFKAFLSSGRSKTQLIKLLLSEWKLPQYARLYGQRQVYFTCDSECYLLRSLDGEFVTDAAQDLYWTTQEEADTRLILHSVLASQNLLENSRIVIRSLDTDVFLLLICHSHRIKRPTYFETGTGNNRRILFIHQIANALGPSVAESLAAFHAFTGCDTTSSFVRKGKKGPFKVMLSNPQFTTFFQGFGNTLDWLNDENFTQLQQFVCAMYGKPNYSNTNSLRHDLFKSRFQPKSTKSLSFGHGIDMSLLPPCQSSLRMHAMRATYQAFKKRPHFRRYTAISY
jgi:hypothetical protein